MNIEFPFFTAVEFFENTPATKCDYVFLAKEDNYVYQNVKTSKFDCILKPISQIELKRTLKRKIEMRESGRVTNYGHYLPASTDYKFKKLLFPTTNGYVFLSPDDILYCEADLEYTKIITRTKQYLISKNLKHFDNMLNGKRFIRTHKSYLINIDHIKQYVRSEGGHVIMSDDKMVPIGRSKKPQFATILGV
jgi:two-component system LytT family response regulator